MSFIKKSINNGFFFTSDYFNDDEDDDDGDRHNLIDFGSLAINNQTVFSRNPIYLKNQNLDYLFGAYSKSKKHRQMKSFITTTIDLILSAILFATLSALYWYGTWAILDDYFLPNDVWSSACFTYIAGLIILLPSYVLQEVFQRFYDRQNKYNKVLLRVLHIYINGWAYTLEWRGCWNLIDKCITFKWRGDLSLAVISITYMLITRSFRFVTSAPYILSLDSSEYNFLSRSRYVFRSLKRKKQLQYLVDFFIAEIIECLIANMAWRNLALLADNWIFPNDLYMNMYVSLGIGYGIYFILMSCQSKLYEKLSKFSLIPRLIVEDIIYLLMFASIILLWRIYYLIPQTFIYNENYKLEIYLATHFGSFIASLILQSSAVIIGCTYNLKDGEINTEETQYFPLNYISSIFSIKN